MTNDEKVVLARQSAQLLEDIAFRAAIDACLVHAQMRWAATAPDDPQSRELCYAQFNAIHSIEDMLKNFVEEGTRLEREQHGN